MMSTHFLKRICKIIAYYILKNYFNDGLQNLHIKQEVGYIFVENVNEVLALFTFILSSMQLSNLKLAA